MKLNDFCGMCAAKLHREAKVVYGYHDKGYPQGKGWLFDNVATVPGEYDTHRALLVCIEELPKKECVEHKPK